MGAEVWFITLTTWSGCFMWMRGLLHPCRCKNRLAAGIQIHPRIPAPSCTFAHKCLLTYGGDQVQCTWKKKMKYTKLKKKNNKKHTDTIELHLLCIWCLTTFQFLSVSCPSGSMHALCVAGWMPKLFFIYFFLNLSPVPTALWMQCSGWRISQWL